MSVARHNPAHAQGEAKALMWDERLALEKEYSVSARFDRFMEYRRGYLAAMYRRDDARINASHRKEQDLLRRKRLDNIRISGPRDGLHGTINDDSIGGDPWWYRKQLQKDHKLPLGPKTHFNHEDFITEMEQTATILNSLGSKEKEEYIPVHYPNSVSVVGLSPAEASRISPVLALEQQFVETHLLFASLLSTQKDIDMTPELRANLTNALRREYHFLKENPSAKAKDFSDILTNYHKLGKPVNLLEEEALVDQNQYDILQNEQIRTLDINDQSLMRATKDKLAKLRGNVGIQQQIKTALEFSKSALQRTIGLQSNPEFYDLTPDERAEYLNFIKEDIKLEQERLDRSIQLSLSEIQQLHEYDRIQLLPQERIPFLPLPKFAARDFNTLNSVPYLANTKTDRRTGETEAYQTQHPFLFDTKNIFNNCMPIAINYTQCIRENQWAFDLSEVTKCNSLSTQLFRCQQKETAQLQVNSTDSWGQVVTNWLWGNDSKKGTSSELSGFEKLVNFDQFEQHSSQQRQNQAEESLQTQHYHHHLQNLINHGSGSRLDRHEDRNQHQIQNQNQNHPPHQFQPSASPTQAQLQEFHQITHAQYGPTPMASRLAISLQQNTAKAQSDQGWLSSWSLPFWNKGKEAPLAEQLLEIPTHSPLTGRLTSPQHINSQIDRSNFRQDRDQLNQTGPLDRQQQRYLNNQQYNDGFETAHLAPGSHRYTPRYNSTPSAPTPLLLTDLVVSKSPLFNSDHLYRKWADNDEIDALTNQAWEHLERYGTASGEHHTLNRVQTPVVREDAYTQIKYSEKRALTYESDPFDGYTSHHSTFLANGAHRYEEPGQTLAQFPT